jgi:hypothetical protein
MKKLLLILSITLISNLIFASFPINQKSQSKYICDTKTNWEIVNNNS